MDYDILDSTKATNGRPEDIVALKGSGSQTEMSPDLQQDSGLCGCQHRAGRGENAVLPDTANHTTRKRSDHRRQMATFLTGNLDYKKVK